MLLLTLLLQSKFSPHGHSFLFVYSLFRSLSLSQLTSLLSPSSHALFLVVLSRAISLSLQYYYYQLTLLLSRRPLTLTFTLITLEGLSRFRSRRPLAAPSRRSLFLCRCPLLFTIINSLFRSCRPLAMPNRWLLTVSLSCRPLSLSCCPLSLFRSRRPLNVHSFSIVVLFCSLSLSLSLSLLLILSSTRRCL